MTWKKVGIMRHTSAWYDGMDDKERSLESADLTTRGVAKIKAAAGTFREFADHKGIERGDLPVYPVGSPQSDETARILATGLGASYVSPYSDGFPKAIKAAHPEEMSPYNSLPSKVEAVWSKFECALPADGCIIVGHDPQMSWLLGHLLSSEAKLPSFFTRLVMPWRPPRANRSFSLLPGELVWLERKNSNKSESPSLSVFAPTDSDTTEELIDKIKSKMNTAKALGAFFTGLVTFAAAQALGAEYSQTLYEVLVGIGFATLLLAVGLYFLSLFRYDELLMPKRFWEAKPPNGNRDQGFVERPPGPDVWVLYQNMIRVWDSLFVPATLWAAIGVTMLVVGFLEPTGWWWIAPIAAAIALAALLGSAYGSSKLTMGVND